MQVSVEEFLKKRKESRPSYVFDLRGMDEYSDHHLAGAHNLPLEFLESNLHRLPFAGELLFYDDGTGQAKQAAAVLFDNGFSDYFYAEEGLEALEKALEGSDLDIKLGCRADDPKEVKMEAMQNLLDFEINPMVAGHGGHFSLVDVDGASVYVQLGGGCQGCGMVDVTLRQGVEKRMREVFPDLEALIDTTEHAEGNNPYYEPSK